MDHSDFQLGREFRFDGKRYRCTDKGSRTVAAIEIDGREDQSWFNGPPYAVVEHLFDENDIEGCESGVI